MPVHHDQAQILFTSQKWLTYREQIIGRLIHQGNAGPDAGVNEQIAGLAVHVAARVGALAKADEVSASAMVRDFVAGSGIEFAEVQERMKGVPGPWKLSTVAS